MKDRRAYFKVWNAEHKEYHRAYTRERTALKREFIRILLEKQGGGCAVCGTTDPGPQWCLDHDHGCCQGQRRCGECYRGVLCNGCNIAEGHLQGNPDRAMALALFMQRNERVEGPGCLNLK